jgi:putative ABC transport system ATP-binding protein
LPNKRNKPNDEGILVSSIVSIECVSKSYGLGPQVFWALREVSLQITNGEFLSIMGPSGSGKSTLLNIMAGLDVPSSGRVFVSEANLAGLSDDARSDARLRNIGFVFQSLNLFPTFSVEENVSWPLEFQGIGSRDAARCAGQVLEQVGVSASARRRRPAELSGGEQQRVAMARALVTQPRILLADEPTGNLDSKTGQAILDILRSLNVERSLTVVLVTHSAFAATYGHRTIELCDGQIIREVRAEKAEGLRESLSSLQDQRSRQLDPT